MIYSYYSFSQEFEFKRWEELSIQENENISSINNAIQKFLDNEYELNFQNFEKTVLKLFNRFKSNIKILGILGILLLGFMTKTSIKNIIGKTEINKETKEYLNTKIDNSLEQITPDITSERELEKNHTNQMEDFLKALAEKESTSNPNAINRLGYIGKYQFGAMALKDLGLYDEINHRKFKKNPNIFPEEEQDKAMIDLLKINKKYLGNYLNKYIGKTINGIKLTKSGLLAGSHLVGAKDVKRFLDSNGSYIPKDGNKVPVTVYIKKFGGYNITL